MIGFHGFLNSQRCRSLSGLNFSSVAELLPAAEMAKLETITSTYVADASWFKKDAVGVARTSEDDQNTE